MRISVTDKAWVDRKIAQFQDTAEFAEALDPAQAQPDTVKSVITDLVRIVRD
ncbi:MAG: hypothetical protein IKH75_14160 [Ruminococcus sp.]|nr:hypothetical protein [Ruminococcus sp.]